MSPHGPQCRSGLVNLAKTSSKRELRYLSELPSDMLQTVDVAITVGDRVLPAHSFPLMAASKVFREVLLMQSHIFNTQQVLQIPLAGDTLGQAISALDHLYEHFMPRQSAKTVPSHKTAISLIIFGHKYDAAISFECAHNTLIAVAQKELSHKISHSIVREHVLTKMLDITYAAEDFKDELLDICVA